MVKPLADLSALSSDELLRRGIAAARVGEAEEARAYLDEATRREPDRADAWLWLGTVAATPQGRRDAFERVLALRPEDAEARDGLARLTEKFGRGLLEEREDGLVSLRCTWHPERETLLRCSRCERPMCPDCARQHPVGLRCKDCMRELRSPLYKVGPVQLVLGLLAGLPAWAAVSLASSLLPWLLLNLLLAAAAGPMVADLVSRAAGRKRGRRVQVVCLVALGLALGLLWAAWLARLSPIGLQPLSSLMLLAVGGTTAWRRLE
ncbi:MAG: tetratricopeptide repeat protein [Caldilineae bacterium]|nr:tetratricopeptide repeat protein [Caldilineae bacterium]